MYTFIDLSSILNNLRPFHLILPWHPCRLRRCIEIINRKIIRRLLRIRIILALDLEY